MHFSKKTHAASFLAKALSGKYQKLGIKLKKKRKENLKAKQTQEEKLDGKM